MTLIRSLQVLACALVASLFFCGLANAQAQDALASAAAWKYTPRCSLEFSHLDFKIDQPLTEKFSLLKKTRQSIAQYAQQANSDLELYKQRLDQMERILASALPITSGSESEELRGRKDAVQIDLDHNAKELEAAEKANRGEQIENLSKIRRDLESEMRFVDSSLKRAEVREAEARRVLEERKKSIDRTNADIEQVQVLIRSAKAYIDCLLRGQSQVDEAINTLLIPETQKNDFKLKISYIFAGMVILVIVGFFVVALRDKAIASAIFSNQTGIQFVTLFSLVIAIILFGITDILQAKELSALLGGISGYILGRVTSERTTGNAVAQQQAQVHPRTIVSATTIAVTAPSTITAAGGVFSDFAVGGKIRVGGATNGANNGIFTVAAVGANQIVVRDVSLVTEGAGALITIASV